ncbi:MULTISPECIES: DUF3349 domain-containing protein [unclassified Luteococcus]|uniref:DUF3349 domain-containing protein n=1 Tax=unclassified Luteococcus TaxID=2639923 RepID=UPI00313D1870
MPKNPLDKILGWLRAGYPQGIDQSNYIALFGVLHRNLTEEEVEYLVLELHRGEGGISSAIPEERVREAIRETVHEEPSREDVLRVLERLEAAGWPHTSMPEPTEE